MAGERSVNDPRPAKADPVGTVKRVTADDGDIEVWQIIRVEGAGDKEVHRSRIAMIREEMEALEDLDEEDFARQSIIDERELRKATKQAMKLEIEWIEGLLE